MPIISICLDCEHGANLVNASTSSTSTLVGWVAESSGRGTLSLIVTCLAAIFLCTWVVIHPRVYRDHTMAMLHKLALFAKAILAPELIAVEALQEWAQCRKMLRDCTAIIDRTPSPQMHCERFKTIHTFYISMMALRYRTPYGTRVIWPNQYQWLLEQGLIEWRSHEAWGLSEETIRDKSKADGATKLLALTQASWFVAQSIMRAAHGLPLSQLESMTLGYIPLFVITYFYWWFKPKDIRSPTMVHLPPMTHAQMTTFEAMSLSNQFDEESTKPPMTYWNIWYLTPRIFEKRSERADRVLTMKSEPSDRQLHGPSTALTANSKDHISHVEQHAPHPAPEDTKITAQGHALDTTARQPEDSAPEIQPQKTRTRTLTGLRKKDRTQSSRPEVVTPKEDIVLACWDPELYLSKLWAVIVLSGISFPALHLACWNTAFPSDMEMWLWRGSAFVSIASMLTFMHFEKVILRWGGLVTIIGIVSPALYLLSRGFMMVEAFLALRAEDPAIYETYQVSSYWLHVL